MTSMMTARRGTIAKPTTLNPASIAGLHAWYDASQLTGYNDGDPVPTFTDYAGSARNAVQATGSKQPVYKTNIQNGKPVLRFDGVDDNMLASAVSLTQPDTIFVVCRAITNPDAKNVFDGSSSRQALTAFTTSGSKWACYAGSAIAASSTASDLLWHVHTVTFNGAATEQRIDGGGLSTVSPGSAALTGLYIGSFNGTAAFWPGDVAELLFYSGALSSGNRVAVEGYLKTKWGTP